MKISISESGPRPIHMCVMRQDESCICGESLICARTERWDEATLVFCQKILVRAWVQSELASYTVGADELYTVGAGELYSRSWRACPSIPSSELYQDFEDNITRQLLSSKS